MMKRVLVGLIFLLGYNFLQGQNWVPLDAGIECFYNANVTNMYVDSSSNRLYVSGIFTQDGNCVPMKGVAEWNGVSWDSIGRTEGNAAKYGVYKYHDTLLVYGNFSNSNLLFYWAKWNGNNWDSIPGGPNAGVTCYAERGDSLFLGG